MALSYVGDCGFKEDPDSKLSVDAFGMDRLVRSFTGRRDQLPQFRRTLVKYKQDEEHTHLTLASFDAQIDRAWATVSVQYAGLLDDELPDVEKEGGWHVATVTLENSRGIQTEIDYGAPTTVFRYVARERPKVQRFKGKMMATEAQFQIMARRGNKTGDLKKYTRGFVGGGVTLPLNIGVNDFGYYTVVITESFTFQRVGRYWQVTETNVGRITDTDESRLSLGTMPRVAVANV